MYVILEDTSHIKSPDETVKVTSWNICSLGDKKKRRSVHNYINKSQENLIVLLDTQMSSETESEHQRCTKNKMYFNSLKSDATGVTVVVNNSCSITDISATPIFPGNLTKYNITYKDEKFTIAALYTLNEKDINFFKT